MPTPDPYCTGGKGRRLPPKPLPQVRRECRPDASPRGAPAAPGLAALHGAELPELVRAPAGDHPVPARGWVGALCGCGGGSELDGPPPRDTLGPKLSIPLTELLRWYLRLLAGLPAVSGLAQLALPLKLGADSAW